MESGNDKSEFAHDEHQDIKNYSAQRPPRKSRSCRANLSLSNLKTSLRAKSCLSYFGKTKGPPLAHTALLLLLQETLHGLFCDTRTDLCGWQAERRRKKQRLTRDDVFCHQE
jgi:hypothetical protein